MLGYTISLAFRWLSTYRWNNFPRVEQVTVTDNIAFSLHVAHFVALLYETDTGIQPDISYIYRRALFSSFPVFIHSDISNDVKIRIRQKDPKISEKLSESAYAQLLSWDLPAFMKKDIEQYRVADTKKVLEEHIYQFAKNWVSYQEAYASNMVHFHAYDQPLESIRQKQSVPEYEMFQKYLSLDFAHHGENERYLLTVRRLQSSFRWNHMHRAHPISVMSHLFFIFFLTYIIGNVEWLDEKTVTDMMTVALYHDIPEAITGDVITPTKKAVPGFEELLAEIEADMLEEYLIGHIQNQPFAADLRNRMLHPWDSQNGALVKLADMFSALFEAKIESQNSKEFKHVYRKLKQAIYKFPNPSVAFLFRYAVDSFEENLEEILQ